jgi:hypothetical protein
MIVWLIKYFFPLAFQYASAKGDPSNQIYVWILAQHSLCAGREAAYKAHQEREEVSEYVHRPYRLGFAEENDVTSKSFRFLKTCVNYFTHPIQVTDVACSIWVYSFCSKTKEILSCFWHWAKY